MATLLAGTAGALAQIESGDRRQDGDQVGVFRTIVVRQHHTAGDIACIFCTVRVDGTVRGDVAVLFGRLEVAEQQGIHGDVATLFSSATVGDHARVEGDMLVALGSSQIAPTASVRGSKAIFSSKLGAAMILGPLLLALGLIWLAVWGVRHLPPAR